MPLEPALRTGPLVDCDVVSSASPTAVHGCAACGSHQDVRVPGDQLDFSWRDGGWDAAARPAGRAPHRVPLRAHPSRRSVRARARPGEPAARAGRVRRQVGRGAARLPRAGLARRTAPPGDRRDLAVPARRSGDRAACGSGRRQAATTTSRLPLLVVHDGPEYDELAGLTTYLGALASRSASCRRFAPPCSPPGPRDDWYSANGAYTRALCLAVLPPLRAEVATTAIVGMGASLGALAMLHAQRRNAGHVRRAVPAVRQLLPPALRRARAPVLRTTTGSNARVDGVLRAGGHPAPYRS